MVALGVSVRAKDTGHFKHIAEERAFHAMHRVVGDRNFRRAVQATEIASSSGATSSRMHKTSGTKAEEVPRSHPRRGRGNLGQPQNPERQKRPEEATESRTLSHLATQEWPP